MIQMSYLVLHGHAYDETMTGAKNMLNAGVVISIDLIRLEYGNDYQCIFQVSGFCDVVWWFNLNV